MNISAHNPAPIADDDLVERIRIDVERGVRRLLRSRLEERELTPELELAVGEIGEAFESLGRSLRDHFRATAPTSRT